MKSEARTSLDEHLILADQTIEMLRMTREMFLKQRRDFLHPILEVGREVHRREKSLTAALVGPGSSDLTRAFIPMHFERIGDNIEAFARATDRLFKEDLAFTDRAIHEIDMLLGKALEMLEATRDVIRTGNRLLVRLVLNESTAFDSIATEFALFHEERLIQGVCQPKASSIYLAMIDYLRGIERHERDVVQKLGAQVAVVEAATRAGHSMV